MSKEEFEISNKDRELQEMLEGNNLEIEENNTKIDIEVPKDKNKLRKGIALATAALLGTTGIGATAMHAKKSAAEEVKQTEKIIYETPTYADPDIDFEAPYIEKGKIIKTSYDTTANSYVQVYQSSNLPREYGECLAYDFNTPEFSQELFVPVSDTLTYIHLDVNVDDPSLECTNFRMSPETKKDNVTRKISQGGSVYIKPGPVKRTESECWFEAIYPEENNLLSGYYCIVDKENENEYVTYNLEDIVYYAYIPETTRLYSKDELYNMYYQVTNTNGVMFSKKVGDIENFTYLPCGTIVKGTTDTKIQKGSLEDQFRWLQCTAEIDGKEEIGYVTYSKTYNNPMLKRVPKEKLEIKEKSNTK